MSERRSFPVLGPVFLSEFVRTSRRGRHAALRTAYALALFLFLLALYRNYSELTRVALMGAGGMARFAETFAYTFLAAQFLAVGALTPAYVAGAIAEEKERKTLEFLLATDLRDREIVLSKLASRALNLVYLVLAGLPVLSALQFMGGVDPQLVLAGFAATLLTVASLAGLSILNSVLCRRARDATVMTYLMAVTYLGLSGLSWLLLSAGWGNFPSTSDWTSPVTVAACTPLPDTSPMATSHRPSGMGTRS